MDGDGIMTSHGENR